MIRDDIATLVRTAAAAAQRAGEIPSVTLPEVVVERPQRPENGDYATGLPLRLKKAVGGPGRPLDLAETIARHVAANDMLRAVRSAPPGFINFFLSESWLRGQVDAIIAAGESFGTSTAGAGSRVQVEFVSANPVGPVHVGNGRGAVTGSTLANVLENAGHTVEREYYVNDAGTQTEVFARTLYARYAQLFGRAVTVPDDGYPGSYMIELAEALRTRFGDRFLVPAGEAPPLRLREEGIALMIAGIREDLGTLGVVYDQWFSEESLFDSGRYEETIRLLRRQGHVLEKEGAVWFSAPDLGQDRENVLVRTGGSPTYFATDIAYHNDKFLQRRVDRVID
ncbi:MAG: arginine--tRNA ligase domain-containing protein, partial [Dehalococcoidia bacterium]